MAVKVNRSFLDHIGWDEYSSECNPPSCLFVWQKTPEGTRFWSYANYDFHEGKMSSKARRIIRRWRAADKKLKTGRRVGKA